MVDRLIDQELVEKIDAILPQTQCRKCGFSGCKPYAHAIVSGQADINQCPPGGSEGIEKIAALMEVPVKSLNTAFGITQPKMIALIDESRCIGCTFCLRACPVDAIVGAAKQMHTVIAVECTGCELCIAPCPMDCIGMVLVENVDVAHDPIELANKARMRYQFKQQRFLRTNGTDTRADNSLQHVEERSSEEMIATQSEQRKRAIIQAAMERAAAIRNQTSKCV